MYQQPISTVTPLAEKPALETVKTAIQSALSHDPNVDRKAASDFLEALKHSVFAWEICDQLLQTCESIEISYLAATMLRQKISNNFNELPLECYSSLKDSILNHLQSNDDYGVQGQLTVAIADLALLLQVWQNPIEDLAKQLGLDVGLMSQINSDFLSIVKALHRRLIFAYILQQICDLNHHRSEKPFKIGARRREEFEDYLISKCKQAITWWLNTLKEVEELRLYICARGMNQSDESEASKMTKCLQMIDKLVGQIYLCYSSWLRIFDEENINDSLTLVDAAFKHLADKDCPDNIHKYAVEAIVSTSCYCDDNRQLDYLVNHLVSQIYTLEDSFKQSISSEDIEKSSNYAKVFTSVAETACVTHVIENKDFRLVELLLSCLNHYDCEIVQETYAFWFMFLDDLQTRLKQTEYTPYIGYINRAVMAITKLCQFDPDEETVASIDKDIHGFRAMSAELIIGVLYVTTVEDFLRDTGLLDNLRIELSKCHWEKTEAVLFLVSCLAKILTRDQHNLRMEIFNCVITQQTNNTDIQQLIATKQVNLRIGTSIGEVHPQIVATSLEIIGSMDNFLADNPDYVILAINYILSSISNPTYRNQLIKPAASALCNIMELNANRHLSNSPELLVIVKDLCTSLEQFDQQAAGELLRCAAFMAEAIKETAVKDMFLCQIVNPIISSLKVTLQPPKKDEDEPTVYLDRLSSFFQKASIHPSIVLELKNFITLIDTELWPVILEVLKVYASTKGHAIERACRTIRYLIRCVKPEWMIQRVAETMINLYKTYPQNSSPLYICSILVDEFANRSPEINQGLFTMLEIFCNLTFTLLELNSTTPSASLLTMKSYPETIDDMMRLFKRFLQKCTAEFVNCKALESIIELSVSSLRIDHPDANENVSKFVTSFIELGQNQEYPRIGDAIRNILGARITDSVIRACLFDLPSSLIGEEATILMTLHNFDKNLFSTWVEASVSTLPKTNIQGIESVSTDQLEEFKKTITTASSVKNMVNALRAFARVYS